MKNVLFIVGFYNSGTDHLIRILNNNPRIDIKNLNWRYDDPTILYNLYSLGHKNNFDLHPIYGDQILQNKDMGSKIFYDFAKFIFVIRPPEPIINWLLQENWTFAAASNYYQFRLRRIYEMHREIANSLVVTWDQVKDGSRLRDVEKYLNLQDDLKHIELEETTESEPMPELREYYEKYFYFLTK